MKNSRVFESTIILLIIILICILFISIVSTHGRSVGWEASVNNTPDYLFVGSDDTLYTFSGNEVTATKSDGRIAWELSIPQKWRVLHNMSLIASSADMSAGSADNQYYGNQPVVAEVDGHVYLYLTKRLTDGEIDEIYADNHLMSISYPEEIMAITPDGEVEWEHQVNSSLLAFYLRISAGDLRDKADRWTYLYNDIMDIKVREDRLFVYHDGCEDVVGTNGTLLYTLRDLAGPAAIDENGYIYAVRVASHEDKPVDQTPTSNSTFVVLIYDGAPITGNLDASGTVVAFKPDGTLSWSREIGENVIRSMGRIDECPEYASLPVYANHTLYVPVWNGVAALSTDGTVKWIRHLESGLYSIYESMPADTNGNFYLLGVSNTLPQNWSISTISPDGQVKSSSKIFGVRESQRTGDAKGKAGILYSTVLPVGMSREQFNLSYLSDHFPAGSIMAYDLAENRTVWKFDIPEEDTRATLLTRANYKDAISWSLNPDPVWIEELQKVHPDQPVIVAYTSIYLNAMTGIYQGTNLTYVYFYSVAHENPVILNKSRCLYVRALYAIDRDGRLIWKRPVGGYIKQAAAGNDTIYYSTQDGRMGGESLNLAAGIAVFATLYLLLRFVGVGAVSRARNVLHINENRNDLIDHISNNPGSTAMEISRYLKMNLGTLRYHLLILSVNHKIVVHKDGDKYVRYFKNSGTYTAEERTLLSLMRREPIRRTLAMLVEKQGLSGTELSKELGVSDTAVYRHVNLLVERGIVTRELQGDRGFVYSIKAKYESYVASMSQ